MNVADLMTRAPKTCRRDDPMNLAAQLMWDHDCGSVVVVDAEGKAIGIITDRDICMAAYTRGLPLSQMTVDSAAAHVLYGVRPDDPLEEAEELMRRHRIRRVPVLDDDRRPIGVLSLGDLARGAARRRGAQVATDAVARTLVEVGAHADRAPFSERR